MEKKIYRSRDNRMFSGVCGGLGEYFDIDPTIIRLIAAFAILSSCFLGLIAYFVCVVVIPQRPMNTPYQSSNQPEQPAQPAQPAQPEIVESEQNNNGELK